MIEHAFIEETDRIAPGLHGYLETLTFGAPSTVSEEALNCTLLPYCYGSPRTSTKMDVRVLQSLRL